MSTTTETAAVVDAAPLEWLDLVDTTRAPVVGDEFLVTGAYSRTQDIGRILTLESTDGVPGSELVARPASDVAAYWYTGVPLNPQVNEGDVIGVVRDTPNGWNLPSRRGDVLTVDTGGHRLGAPNGVIGRDSTGRHVWAGAYVKLTGRPKQVAEADQPQPVYTDTTVIPHDVMVAAIRRAASDHGLEADGERFIRALANRTQLDRDGDADLPYVVRDHWGDQTAAFRYATDARQFLDATPTSETKTTYTVAKLRDRLTEAAGFFGWCEEAQREFDKAFGPEAGTWRVVAADCIDDDEDEGEPGTLPFEVYDPTGRLVASCRTRADAAAYVHMRKAE